MSRRRGRTSRSCRSSAPAASCRRGQPAMRRADAVEAAEARRHAHRAAGIGAERGVAERRPRPPPPSPTTSRPGTRPGARGLSGVPSNGFSPRMPSETSSVIVLPISVGAGVEQRLHRPGMPLRHRVLARPIGVAAAGRMAGDIEQVLGREGQAGERSACAPGDAHPRPGHESVEAVERVGHQRGSARRRRRRRDAGSRR